MAAMEIIWLCSMIFPCRSGVLVTKRTGSPETGGARMLQLTGGPQATLTRSAGPPPRPQSHLLQACPDSTSLQRAYKTPRKVTCGSSV